MTYLNLIGSFFGEDFMKKTLILSIACFLFSCGGGGGSLSALDEEQPQPQLSSGVSGFEGDLNDFQVIDVD